MNNGFKERPREKKRKKHVLWNAQFTKASALFFPLACQEKHFRHLNEWPTLGQLNQALPKSVSSWSGQKIIFVLQQPARKLKGFTSLYEPRIFLAGEVLTRQANWHDLFNAHMWFIFPKTKAALNMRQFIAFDEQAAFPWHKAQEKRLREQELLTMFDEGGCLLAESGDKTRPFLFGHAIYEELLLRNTQSLSMLCVRVTCDDQFFALPLERQLEELDAKTARFFANRTNCQREENFGKISLSEALTLID